MSYRKMMKWQKSHPRGGKTQYLGFTVLAANERRGMPLHSASFLERCHEDETGETYKQSLREWELETRRLLKANPSLVIIGKRPQIEEEDSL